jgi:hypothetical protein
MYSVTITVTRQSTDVPWFWETTLADHTTNHATIANYYNGYITIGERTFSDDNLTATTVMTAETSDIYYDCKKICDADPDLVRYWLERDNYNFDNNIFRRIEG